MTYFCLEMNTQETQDTRLTIDICLLENLVQIVENVSIRSANVEREVHYSDIISNNASFADALSNVEPHQHLSGHESISQGILQNKTKKQN